MCAGKTDVVMVKVKIRKMTKAIGIGMSSWIVVVMVIVLVELRSYDSGHLNEMIIHLFDDIGGDDVDIVGLDHFHSHTYL